MGSFGTMTCCIREYSFRKILPDKELTIGTRMHELAEDDEFMKKTWREIAEVISKIPGLDMSGFEGF